MSSMTSKVSRSLKASLIKKPAKERDSYSSDVSKEVHKHEYSPSMGDFVRWHSNVDHCFNRFSNIIPKLKSVTIISYSFVKSLLIGRTPELVVLNVILIDSDSIACNSIYIGA